MNISLMYFGLSVLIILNGCSSTVKEKFGLYDKTVPNEFAVISYPPLSIPPTYELAKPNHALRKKTKVENVENSKGEELLLNKIQIDHQYFHNNTNNANKKSGFFKKLFTKNNYNSKDATEDSAANMEDRTYKSKSLQLMKTDISNRKICNISGGEVIYCDKNTFMKNFSFPTSNSK